MKWIVGVVGVRQRTFSVHRLVAEVIAGQTMKLIRTRFCRQRNLEATPASVFDRKRVDLNVCFLDSVGVRREIQDSLPNGTGDVKPVHDPHIRNRTLTVDTDVDGRFRRIIIHACSGSARSHARTAHEAQSRDAGGQAHEREHVTARNRQSRKLLGFERQLISRLGRIQQRDLGSDGHRLGNSAGLES